MTRFKREDVTVVIAVRDRCDYRLVNCLKSIRSQEYDQGLIAIVLVDYGSMSDYIQGYEAICKKYNVKYMRIENQLSWCRSHALNIGIRNAGTKYLFNTDVDIILKSNYIKTAVHELKKDPMQVVLSHVLYTSEEDISGEIDTVKEYPGFENYIKLSPAVGAGINFALTYFYHIIRGYDEYYKWWGVKIGI